MKLFDLIWNYIVLKYYNVKIGKNFRCDGRIIIQGKGTYTIGNNVRAISKELLNPIGGNKTVLQTLDGGKIFIGDNVGLSHAILCSREEIRIDKNSLIGGGVKIYDNDFHSINYDMRIKEVDTDIKKAPIWIKEGAFIGAHSIILKGVTVGLHSVVGAGSVVTKNIPDYEIWAGNPAKKVGSISDGEN